MSLSGWLADGGTMAERLPTRESPHPSTTLPIFREGVFVGSEEDLHELRVRIPVDLHRQLLSLKVLRGRSLAETVSMALDIYFAGRTGSAEAAEDDGGSSTHQETQQ